MTQLDDDLAAIRSAPDQATRNQALLVWLADATTFINQNGDDVDQLQDAARRIRQAERALADSAAMIAALEQRLADASETIRRLRSPFSTLAS